MRGTHRYTKFFYVGSHPRFFLLSHPGFWVPVSAGRNEPGQFSRDTASQLTRGPGGGGVEGQRRAPRRGPVPGWCWRGWPRAAPGRAWRGGGLRRRCVPPTPSGRCGPGWASVACISLAFFPTPPTGVWGIFFHRRSSQRRKRCNIFQVGFSNPPCPTSQKHTFSVNFASKKQSTARK